MTSPSSTRQVTRLLLAACSLASLFAAGCTRKNADDAAAAGGVHAEVAASTTTASVETFTHTLSAIGTVVGRPGRMASLSAPSPTRVSHVYVSPGQRVSAGAPLVEFEQAGFASASSGAQAALTAAERNAERATRLANEGIVPRKDAETAAADLAAARTAAVTARRAQQLSVLRSPVSGVVTRMSAVLGASADAGQVLVEVADPSAFDVVLSLGPTEAGAVHPGAHVTLTAGEKAGGEPLGTGVVASVGAVVDTTSRSVAIRVTMSSPKRALRLGESVYGAVAVESRPHTVTVPVEALVPDADGYKVFVVDAKGIAIGRTVKVGDRTEAKAEITEGLKGGETIVTQGAFGVADSAKVTKSVPVAP